VVPFFDGFLSVMPKQRIDKPQNKRYANDDVAHGEKLS
jgi:hypothetical protein